MSAQGFTDLEAIAAAVDRTALQRALSLDCRTIRIQPVTRTLAFDNLLRLGLSPGSERVGLQSRLRWRFLPGSDIFLVYRNNLPVGSTVTADPFHAVTLKVAYYIRSFIG